MRHKTFLDPVTCLSGTQIDVPVSIVPAGKHEDQVRSQWSEWERPHVVWGISTELSCRGCLSQIGIVRDTRQVRFYLFNWCQRSTGVSSDSSGRLNVVRRLTPQQVWRAFLIFQRFCGHVFCFLNLITPCSKRIGEANAIHKSSDDSHDEASHIGMFPFLSLDFVLDGRRLLLFNIAEHSLFIGHSSLGNRIHLCSRLFGSFEGCFGGGQLLSFVCFWIMTVSRLSKVHVVFSEDEDLGIGTVTEAIKHLDAKCINLAFLEGHEGSDAEVKVSVESHNWWCNSDLGCGKFY